MAYYDKEDLNSWSRAAVITQHLMLGSAISAPDVAKSLGIHLSTAERMLTEMSRVLPIVRDDDYRWQLAEWVRPGAIDSPRLQRIQQPHGKIRMRVES